MRWTEWLTRRRRSQSAAPVGLGLGLVPPPAHPHSSGKAQGREASAGATSSLSADAPVERPLGVNPVTMVTCPRCGKQHSAAMRAGLARRVVACSCGNMLTISNSETVEKMDAERSAPQIKYEELLAKYAYAVQIQHDRVSARALLHQTVECFFCHKVVAPASRATTPDGLGLVCPFCHEWWVRPGGSAGKITFVVSS